MANSLTALETYKCLDVFTFIKSRNENTCTHNKMPIKHKHECNMGTSNTAF